MNKICVYCKSEIEIHHSKLHQRQCYLNHDNLKKICEYLLTGISDHRLLKRANFYRWAQSQGILTSISITNRLKSKSWYHALYQLLIYGYLHNFIDYEYCEIILYIISSGSMWMSNDELRKYHNKSLEKEYAAKGIKADDLYENRFLLLMYVLERTNRDLLLSHGALDENKETVDLNDAISFYADFAPDVLLSLYKEGKVSEDAKSIIRLLTLI